MVVEVLGAERVARSKRAFTTRRVGAENMQSLICGVVTPSSGDLVLARVDEIRKHKRLELTDGRKALLFPGDEIVVCFGNRYAPDQYEAVIGVDLSSCDLVAAGGVAARELSRNLRMIEPTHITPIGIVGDRAGNRLNVRNFSVPDHQDAPPIPTILSVGTSMNAGKTLTATSLVRGLKAAGCRVAAIKATGTGSGNDVWIVKDAGADVVLDFTDAGFAGTYLIPQPEIEAATRRIINHAAWLGCDIAVVEIADGLQHLETAALIEAKHLWSDTLGVVFAAYDAMGAKYGVDLLQALGYRVLALSGRIALSPLAMREAERATRLRVHTPWELQEGALVDTIFEATRKIAVGPTSWFAANGVHSGTNGVHAGMAPDGRRAHEATDASPPIELRVQQAQSVNGASADLCGKLGFVAAWAMAFDIAALCNAAPGVRSAQRTNRRNGYRRRRWKTCLGEIEVSVPRLRRGAYRPAFLTRSTLNSGDMKILFLEALAPGMSLSALGRLLEEIGATGPSQQEVAGLGAELNRIASINGQCPVANEVHAGQDKSLTGTNSANGSMDQRGRDYPLVAASQDDDDVEDNLPVLADPAAGEYYPPGEWQYASGSNPHGDIQGIRAMTLAEEFEDD